MNSTMQNGQFQYLSYLPTPLKTKGRIHPRSQFSQEEDEKLTNLVNQYGDDNWEDIASLMKNRNIRQCKERWLNYLSPNVKNCPWTQEEDDLLEKLYLQYGPKWVKISQMIEGRTDINIKNRFLLIQRHKKRKAKKQKELKCNQNEKKEIDKIELNKNGFLTPFFDEIIDQSFDFVNEWDLFGSDY